MLVLVPVRGVTVMVPGAGEGETVLVQLIVPVPPLVVIAEPVVLTAIVWEALPLSARGAPGSLRMKL